MMVKLLTEAEYHLEFLSLNGGCRGSSKSTHVKMLHCWKSHGLAQKYGNCSKIANNASKEAVLSGSSLLFILTSIL